MTAPKAPLRAVQADEKPPVKRAARKPRKPTVSEAAAAGDHRGLLVAMRERIARAVSDPDCSPRDLAALTRRLQDIAKEIELIDLRMKEEADEDGASPDEAWSDEAL